jgi:hypothetical protein
MLYRTFTITYSNKKKIKIHQRSSGLNSDIKLVESLSNDDDCCITNHGNRIESISIFKKV